MCTMNVTSFVYTLCPNKNVHFLFFEYFSQKSVNFYNAWFTHMANTFNSFCNSAFMKFQLSRGIIIIGYLRCIQFLRETMEI